MTIHRHRPLCYDPPIIASQLSHPFYYQWLQYGADDGDDNDDDGGDGDDGDDGDDGSRELKGVSPGVTGLAHPGLLHGIALYCTLMHCDGL